MLVSRSLLVTSGTNAEHIAYKQKDRSHRPWLGLGKNVDHIAYGFFGLVLHWLQGLICISLLNEKKNEAWLKFIDCSLNNNGFLFVFVVEQKKLQLHYHLSHWSVILTVMQKVCTFFLVETHVHRLFPKVLNAIASPPRPPLSDSVIISVFFFFLLSLYNDKNVLVVYALSEFLAYACLIFNF